MELVKHIFGAFVRVPESTRLWVSEGCPSCLQGVSQAGTARATEQEEEGPVLCSPSPPGVFFCRCRWWT